jgi:hypothetical protein
VSQGALFAFGSVILFIVVTGAFAYGLLRAREWALQEGLENYTKS